MNKLEDNIIKKKSYDFALKIIKTYKFLVNEKNEQILSKQVLRSGTSVGANVEEACAGQSKKDFIAKFSIALKEAFETKYWLTLMRDSNELESEYANGLIDDCEELIKIVTKILKTARINSK